MLIKTRDLERILAGEVDLVFRRWKRPTVKTGGTLRTHRGVLAICSVEPVARTAISQSDARRAGFASLAELLAELDRRPGGTVYRIALRPDGADPRVALRERADLSEAEVEEIDRRLDRFDARSRRGLWTLTTLRLIDEHPETLAAELAALAGQERAWFKTNVRKLKELGLTESLRRGYRLSPRGMAYLRSSRRRS